jgi:hypothetical protein
VSGDLIDLGRKRREKAFEELRARVKRGDGCHSALAFEGMVIGVKYPDNLPPPRSNPEVMEE